jgi:hypothetical protein
MADDPWRSPLVWSEMGDGSFETDVPDSLGQLRVRHVDNRYFEIEATIVSYERREWRVLTDRVERDAGFEDSERAKEFTQAFLDNHPRALEALKILWDEADLFAQNYILGRYGLGRKSRP